MGKAEAGIQLYVLARLQILERQGRVYYFRNNSFAGKIQRYNGTQGYIDNAKPGMPDVVMCLDGTFVGIELKSLVGRQSDSQKRAQALIEGAGGKYYIVKTPEEFEAVITNKSTPS